jgi:hypothetical protein
MRKVSPGCQPDELEGAGQIPIRDPPKRSKDFQNINLASNGRNLTKDSRLRRETENLVYNLISLKGGQTFDELYQFVVNKLRSHEPYVIPAIQNLVHAGNLQTPRLLSTIDEFGRRTYFINESEGCSS